MVQRGKTSNVSYLIDINNFVCRQLAMSQPSCQDIQEFIEKIEEWLKQYQQTAGRLPDVLLVLDPGAAQCGFPIRLDYARLCVAPPSTTADRTIAEQAHAIRRAQPDRHIRVVTDDRQDWFAQLAGQGFEVLPNHWLRQKLSDLEPLDDYAAYEDGRRIASDLGQRSSQLKPGNSETNAEALHLRRLESPDWETRKRAARALRHFVTPRSYHGLKRRVHRDANSKVRRSALGSLIQVGDQLAKSDIVYRWHLRDALERLVATEADQRVRASASAWLQENERDWI